MPSLSFRSVAIVISSLNNGWMLAPYLHYLKWHEVFGNCTKTSVC
jgi:hypothetical protein